MPVLIETPAAPSLIGSTDHYALSPPPNLQVFALFDKLILLAPVGEQVYYGSTHEAVKYFSSPALDFAFHKGANPAEFVMSASQVRATTDGPIVYGLDEAHNP